MARTFIPSTTLPETQAAPVWWFAFVGNKLLIEWVGSTAQVPQLKSLADIGLQPIRTQFVGMLEDQACYSAELPPEVGLGDRWTLKGLRELYGALEDDLYAIAGRAFQIMEWDRTHQFCGHCGTPTVQLPQERARNCPKCGLTHYPRLSPAVIVLISRGDEVLLGRAPRFPPGMYSVIAGFVEPGESLEEAVVREVREETGVEIKDIRYFGSQPWPFPNALMVGFTATYAGGEIVVQVEELVDVAWFHKHHLPAIPTKPSIARKLLDWFVTTPSTHSSQSS